MPSKKSKIFQILILIVLLVCLLILGRTLTDVENLQDELYRERLKNLNLIIKNRELSEQANLLSDDWNVVLVTATAYAPLDNKSGICADGNPNVTSVGVKPGPGVIAVNPNLIPYYSKMIIVGDGWVMEGQALDTGGALRKDAYKIDIFHESYEEAINFGRQQVTVFYKEV